MTLLCKYFACCVLLFHAGRSLCSPLFTERLRLLYCILTPDQLTHEHKSLSGKALRHSCTYGIDPDGKGSSMSFYAPANLSAKENIQCIPGRNEAWRKLQLKIQTEQPPTFHMECVCLCGELGIRRTGELVCISSGLYFLRWGVQKAWSTVLAPVMR